MLYDNIKSFAEAVRWVNESGNERLPEIISLFRHYTELLKEHIVLDSLVKDLQTRVDDLKEKESNHKLKLSEMEKIKSMGLTLGNLKQLHNTLSEISEENGMPPESAVARFFADIENDYHEKLGFEIKIRELKEAYEELNERYNRVSALNDSACRRSHFIVASQRRQCG